MLFEYSQLTPVNIAWHMLGNCINQIFFVKRLDQVLIRPYQLAASAVKKAILAGQHYDGRSIESGVVFYQRTCLIPIQPGHHDIKQDDIRVVLNNLG
jgi:hypothetical protein